MRSAVEAQDDLFRHFLKNAERPRGKFIEIECLIRPCGPFQDFGIGHAIEAEQNRIAPIIASSGKIRTCPDEQPARGNLVAPSAVSGGVIEAQDRTGEQCEMAGVLDVARDRGLWTGNDKRQARFCE